MVFLTSVDIVDTGFLTKSGRTTQLSGANRVNSGVALRLKGVDMEITSSSNLDSETYTGNIEDITIDTPLVSVNADEITLTLFVNSKNTDTNNPWGENDMGIVSQLLRLPKTAGFKALYYPVSGNYRNRNQQLIWELGNADTTESQGDINLTLWNGSAGVSGFDLTDVNYIAVRFNNCSIAQDGDSSKIEIKLTGVITG